MIKQPCQRRSLRQAYLDQDVQLAVLLPELLDLVSQKLQPQMAVYKNLYPGLGRALTRDFWPLRPI